MRRIGFLLLVLSSLAGVVQAGEAGPEQRLDARLKLLYRTGRDRGGERAHELAGRYQRVAGPEAGLLLLVRYGGDPGDLAKVGFRVQARIGSIYTGSLPAERLGELAELPGVFSVQLSQRMSAPPATASSALRRNSSGPRATPRRTCAGMSDAE